MRIITGIARGTKLNTLAGEDITRPTSERVKEGIFSAIQFDIADTRVLDLFCGSGQMALEALSRGADSAVLIDESADAIEIIKQNAQKTNLYKSCRISRMDYSEYLKSASGKERFNIVFLDPPYTKDMENEVLKKVARADILADNALVICETNVDTLNHDVHGLEFIKQYKYRYTYVTIFRNTVV